MTTKEKRNALEAICCESGCESCPIGYDLCVGCRPLGWDDEQIEAVYDKVFPKKSKKPHKEISVINRALGIIEGVALCADDPVRATIFTAVEMISEVIDKEDSL